MAEERIGNDPLAWLMEETDEPQPETAEQPEAEAGAAAEPPAEEPTGEAPAAAADTAGDEALVLGDDLSVAEAAELQRRLGELLDGRVEVVLDAGAVERVDAAGLQVLVAFYRAVEGQEGKVRWRAVSEPLREAARLAGLDGALGLG